MNMRDAAHRPAQTGNTGRLAAALVLDAAVETERIAAAIRRQVFGQLNRRGAVVGISGGVDSAVVAALCAHALGTDRVLGLCMPERQSSGDSLRLGSLLAAQLGITSSVEEITPALEGSGCYRRQTEAIRTAVPEFAEGWKFKLVLPSAVERSRLNVSMLTVSDVHGNTRTVRLDGPAYLKLVAATNYKQRVRTMTAYYHADCLRYAVAGTPNRLEHDQGFFVKQGDGAADFKPIAHLYKTQVYQLARHLRVPEEICTRVPTTDTYPLEQTQEEFYFGLPSAHMDLSLHAHNQGVPVAELAAEIGLTAEQAGRIYQDIEAKRRATRYGHATALLVEPVPEVQRPCAE